MADTTELNRDLQILESDLRKLEGEYNMYFSGRMPRPPWETRSRVEAAMKRIDRSYIQNYGDKFRFTSTALGKAKGLEVARDRAALSAKAEFVKWLKERVSVYSKTEDETILFLEGSEQNDADTLKESGKSVEKTGKKIETIAEGLVRGLQVIHTEVTDKDKMLTVVYGWDAKTAEASKKVRKDLNSDDKSSGTKEGDSAKKSGPKDKKIEDKKMTSEDAKKFLGDK